jgi:GntR family transcriptional repressor for pyruvate dehydrogenase complex
MQDAVKGGDRARFAKTDLAWHAALAEASQNRLISRMVFTTRSLLREFIEVVLQTSGSDLVAAKGHQRVTEAVVKGDVEGAKAAMTGHLNDVQEMILRRFAEPDHSHETLE